MGAQDFGRVAVLRMEEDGVVGFARRMAFGEVQRGEIVPVILDVRPFGDGKAHVAENGGDFLECAILTGGSGCLIALATRNAVLRGLDIRQAYLLTAAIWIGLPLFAALPFYLGAPGLNFTDAYFEAVSGITTTGSTVIVGLDALPEGMNLWRGMLNWIGGLGIAFIAMIFLPIMRVGGMQFFRTEGFDTFGKALPRATDIARAHGGRLRLGVSERLGGLCAEIVIPR